MLARKGCHGVALGLDEGHPTPISQWLLAQALLAC